MQRRSHRFPQARHSPTSARPSQGYAPTLLDETDELDGGHFLNFQGNHFLNSEGDHQGAPLHALCPIIQDASNTKSVAKLSIYTHSCLQAEPLIAPPSAPAAGIL